MVDAYGACILIATDVEYAINRCLILVTSVENHAMSLLDVKSPVTSRN